MNSFSRGVIIVDQCVSELQNFIRDRNFRTILRPDGFSDYDLIKFLLPHRILITSEMKEYHREASSYEFGIILLEKELAFNPMEAARRVSDVFNEFQLGSKRYGFLVTLSAKVHTYEELST